MAELAELLTKAGSYLPTGRTQLLQDAFEFAAEKHLGQKRLSGDPYIEHPLQTSLFLADLRQDAATLAAALLHDVIEDCHVPREELARRFGPDVARLVDGVTKLARLDALAPADGGTRTDDGAAHAESIRKMLLAMAEDIRVVLIKLADRLHNMRTLDVHAPKRRQAIAQETLDIYAPLAHRLGIWEIKWQLEDLAFRHVHEETYRDIARLLAKGRQARERYLAQQAEVLRRALAGNGIRAEVKGRPKSIYSIYQKMGKYAEQGKDFGQIYDLYALRVLVDTQADCYNALGVVHSLWRPIPGQFDDYIANPKENLYQSLHTAVMCEGATPLEVQIRTWEMHRLAEYGVAAHWSYKEGRSTDAVLVERMSWLRQLLEWQREVSGAEEFLESVRTDIFQDQVYVYTPKGDIKELPTGATPIDFAYHIHTELGHRCVGAKVNGRLVALDTRLQSGDTVEVRISKQARGPSLDWLNPALGYIGTASARQKIRHWFRRQERSVNIAQGREVLQRTLRRLGMSGADEKEIARTLKYDSADELLAALGSSSLTSAQMEHRLTVPDPAPAVPSSSNGVGLGSATAGVSVLGVGDLLTRTASCCNPLPGENIIGYITRNRGVTVHRQDCANVRNEDEKERLVPVTWGPSQQVYAVRVEITGLDRVGLLRDVSSLVSAEKVNMGAVASRESTDGTAVITLTLYTTGTYQLNRLFARLEGVHGVLNVSRVNIPSRSAS